MSSVDHREPQDGKKNNPREFIRMMAVCGFLVLIVLAALKALDTATARILTASNADIPKTKAIEELLSRSVLPSASTSGGLGGPPNPAQRAAYTGETKRIGQLEVTLKGCHNQPEGIHCEALIKTSATCTGTDDQNRVPPFNA